MKTSARFVDANVLLLTLVGRKRSHDLSGRSRTDSRVSAAAVLLKGLTVARLFGPIRTHVACVLGRVATSGGRAPVGRTEIKQHRCELAMISYDM